LVYAEEGKQLFQGLDNQLLLDRVEKASVALARIPDLVEGKKWSQITGVLTGPMGELIRTMGQLADLSENASVAQSNVKLVKTDLYAISAAVERKEGGNALKYHAAATKNLVAFVKSL
jgi:hypothetical protein